MKFPTLYKKTSTGADQMWEIETVENTIIVRFGQVDGKIQTTSDVIATGKNIGRSNETTPVQQAEAEAKSQWEKKLKKGYVQSIEGARTGEVDDIIEGGFFPMLAHKYDERGDSITFPAYLQPKLDGHRCVAIVTSNSATLWSRTRKRITSMPHIEKALIEQFGPIAGGLGDSLRLDGELYNHAYHNRFEELTHFIRSAEPEPGHDVLQYHIYDVVMTGMPFSTRISWLSDVWSDFDLRNSALQLVHTMLVGTEEDMMLSFEQFNGLGYEGAMVRNAMGVYVEKRSIDLQKLKTFQDEEFKIVGVSEGRGKLVGHAIFQCELPNGSTFDVKMRGYLDQLKSYFQNPETVIGRELTVKFQGYTKYGKPRFPVGWRFSEKL